ncbi:MAG: transpeptidase family protein [candidate division Zixibacteria bacterium]|nr:transpeptidase family protein [candidate division Zixibacteria bacterium]
MTNSIRKRLESKLIIVKIVFAIVLVVFIGRLAWLQLIKRESFLNAANNQQNLIINIQAKRGIVFDRNNKVMAQDIDSYSYYVVPENIKNKKNAAKKIGRLTGTWNWQSKFKKHSRFLWVSRKTSKQLEAKFEKSGIETLNRIIEPKRVYPSGRLALSLLGRVDTDNNGLSGLELQYDDYLSGQDGKAVLKRDGLGHCYLFDEEPLVVPETGSDIVTTIDLNLQQIVEQEMTTALIENNSAYGIGLFIKAGTGEILACAVLDSLGKPATRNRAITDQYEPGSTFKVIATAEALSSGRFELNDSIFVENGKFRLGRRTIRDDHEYDTLSVGDVLIYSSNIGVSKMALELGDDKIYKAVKEAGFVTPLGVDFPGEAGGYIEPLDWREHYLANISFGHGVSATPLQIVSLYGAIASGGNLYRPFFAKELIRADGSSRQLARQQKIRKVYSSNMTSVLDTLLRQVVLKGTATQAISKMVTIAGKTGTALKLKENGRGYDWRKARASFVGYFPADNPMVVGIIMFDEPKTSRYGGVTAAPVFRCIAERYYSLPQQLVQSYASSDQKTMYQEYKASQISGQGINNILKTTSGFYDEPGWESMMPDFKGLTIRQALILASKRGIECEIKGSGIVDKQVPQAGKSLKAGTIIQLRCNSG